MDTIRSPDGVALAYERHGAGPPLVLVHGSAGHHAEWRDVVPCLAETCTVYAFDRRGRGGSGDAETYAIEREYADVAAMAEHAADQHPAESVSVLASSYGAICALHAILETDAVDRLVLYEPPLGDVPESEGAAEGLERQMEAEGVPAAVETFLENAIGLTASEITSMRGNELWNSRIDAFPAVPREIRATQRDLFDPTRFEDVALPTTLLVGEESPEEMHTATDAVAEALERSSIVSIAGQSHMAMREEPDRFVDIVRDVLDTSRH